MSNQNWVDWAKIKASASLVPSGISEGESDSFVFSGGQLHRTLFQNWQCSLFCDPISSYYSHFSASLLQGHLWLHWACCDNSRKSISRLLVTSPKSLLKVTFTGYRDSCSDIGGLITEEKTATFLLMTVVRKKHCLDIGCDAVSEREDRKAPGRR